MPLAVIRNDITKMSVDAIVNAANTSLLAGGGVCGAIFSAAGADKLQRACDSLAPIETGDAVVTKGFALPAKYIIHTAGPVYLDGKHNEEALLRACYKNSLDLARKQKCESIAFPLISSGIYGYPKAEALEVATSEISDWLKQGDMDVSLVVFDKTAFVISTGLLGEVRAFIDENYVDERNLRFSRGRTPPAPGGESIVADAAARSIGMFEREGPLTPDAAAPMPETAEKSKRVEAGLAQKRKLPPAPPAAQLAPTVFRKPETVGDAMVKLNEPFSATLMRLIDAKGKTDVEVYKRANLDRKLFSKIRSGKGYMPSKKTAIALSVALELSLSETRDLLERAGFALSRSVVFDVIIEFFITRKKYDVYEINNVLFEYDQPLLGG